jgi:hypothetical protein
MKINGVSHVTRPIIAKSQFNRVALADANHGPGHLAIEGPVPICAVGLGIQSAHDLLGSERYAYERGRLVFNRRWYVGGIADNINQLRCVFGTRSVLYTLRDSDRMRRKQQTQQYGLSRGE